MHVHNYFQNQMHRLRSKQYQEGPLHDTTWTFVYYGKYMISHPLNTYPAYVSFPLVDGIEWGRGQGRNMDAAKESAAAMVYNTLLSGTQ